MKKEINELLKNHYGAKEKIKTFDQLKDYLDRKAKEVLGQEEEYISSAEKEYLVCPNVQFSLKDESDFIHAYHSLNKSYQGCISTCRRRIIELTFDDGNERFNYLKLLKLVKKETKDDLLIQPYSSDYALQFDITRRNGVLKDRTYVNLNTTDEISLFLSLYNLAESLQHCSFRQCESIPVCCAA